MSQDVTTTNEANIVCSGGSSESDDSKQCSGCDDDDEALVGEDGNMAFSAAPLSPVPSAGQSPVGSTGADHRSPIPVTPNPSSVTPGGDESPPDFM